MRCYCKDEFDWLMKMIEKGDCFFDWEDICEFIDEDFLELRYMNKRFGYLFYDDYIYISKKLMVVMLLVLIKRNILFVVNLMNHYIMVQMKHNKKGYLFSKIPLEDTERYQIKYLDEIDKGEPYVTNDDKKRDEEIKKTKNILKKIKLVQPEIYNSEEFYEVFYSKEFDNIELEKDRKKFYEQVKKFVLGGFSQQK